MNEHCQVVHVYHFSSACLICVLVRNCFRKLQHTVAGALLGEVETRPPRIHAALDKSTIWRSRHTRTASNRVASPTTIGVAKITLAHLGKFQHDHENTSLHKHMPHYYMRPSKTTASSHEMVLPHCLDSLKLSYKRAYTLKPNLYAQLCKHNCDMFQNNHLGRLRH